jgi:uncharacterized protein YbjT (DUF2867 family)
MTTLAGPVAVIGGAGRTGRIVVDGLLDRGDTVRVASRRAATGNGADLRGNGVSTFYADVRDGRGLDEALDGVAAVLYLVEPGTANSGPDRPETTLYQGVRHALDNCPTDLARFVLVSSIYVTRPEHQFNEWGHLLDWRLRGEGLVRDSGVPYTVIRPSWLTDDRGGRHGIRFEQGDTGDGEVARADVATACLRALDTEAAAGVTFELFNSTGRPPASWEPLFAALAKDPVPAH